MVSEPDAAAVHFASGERMKAGDVIAVYDLGGGTFDAAVLRRTATGFEQIGEPKGIERLGGVDFDEAVLADVISQSGLDAAALTDADTPALVRLRDDCQDAKEALSDDLEATVPVNVGSINTRVKIDPHPFRADGPPTTAQRRADVAHGGVRRRPAARPGERGADGRRFVTHPARGDARARGAAPAGGVHVEPEGGGGARRGTHRRRTDGHRRRRAHRTRRRHPSSRHPSPAPPPPITTMRTPMRPTPPPAAPPVAPLTAPPTRRRWWLVAVAAVVAIGIGVGAGIAVSGNDDNVTPTTDETVVSTDETTPDSTATDEDTSPQQTDATIAPVVTAGS